MIFMSFCIKFYNPWISLQFKQSIFSFTYLPNFCRGFNNTIARIIHETVCIHIYVYECVYLREKCKQVMHRHIYSLPLTVFFGLHKYFYRFHFFSQYLSEVMFVIPYYLLNYGEKGQGDEIFSKYITQPWKLNDIKLIIYLLQLCIQKQVVYSLN